MKPGEQRTLRLAVARAALARGPLIATPWGYGTGKETRSFGHRTIDELLRSGEAVRVGTGVISTQALLEARAAVAARAAEAGVDKTGEDREDYGAATDQ